MVECPYCPNNSLTFDPFSIVSLSLPEISISKVDIFFIPYNPDQSIKKIQIDGKSIHKFNDFSIKHLKNKICDKFETSPERSFIGTLEFDNFGRILKDEENMSSIIEGRQSLYSIPKIFLWEFSDEEFQLNGNQFFYLYFKVDWQIYDKDSGEFSDYDRFSYSSIKFQEDLIYT